MNMKQIKK